MGGRIAQELRAGASAPRRLPDPRRGRCRRPDGDHRRARRRGAGGVRRGLEGQDRRTAGRRPHVVPRAARGARTPAPGVRLERGPTPVAGRAVVSAPSPHRPSCSAVPRTRPCIPTTPDSSPRRSPPRSCASTTNWDTGSSSRSRRRSPPTSTPSSGAVCPPALTARGRAGGRRPASARAPRGPRRLLVPPGAPHRPLGTPRWGAGKASVPTCRRDARSVQARGSGVARSRTGGGSPLARGGSPGSRVARSGQAHDSPGHRHPRSGAHPSPR